VKNNNVRYSTTPVCTGTIALVRWENGRQHVEKLFSASAKNDDRARQMAVELNRKAGVYG